MKIKTITCHEVYNHGASLQEYALLKYLNNDGHIAEAIHYKPAYLSGHFNLWGIGNTIYNLPIIKQLYLLAKLPQRLLSLKRKKAFDQFHAQYIPTGKVKYISNAELKSNLPDADVFICGSDQIWNSFFQNGKDSAFYLDFVPDHKLKISYAASFAIDELDEIIKPFVKEKVNRLNHVSVRETSGIRILNDLGIKDVVQVLDPVFLLEKEHWMQFVFPVNEAFIFIYDFDSNPTLKKMALEYKSKHDVKIFTVNQNIDYADKNFYYEGPETFLSLMNYAHFVFTNSFHSVAFSLLFEKQFAVFDRNEKINTRMRDLLDLFHLNNLIKEPVDVERLNKINYQEIYIKLLEYNTTSKAFIKNALTDV